MNFSLKTWTDLVDSIIAETCKTEGVTPQVVDRIRKGFVDGRIDLRPPSDSLQQPPLLFPGLKTAPWHNTDDYSWTALLLQNFSIIRQELEHVLSRDSLHPHPETSSLAQNGSWSEFRFYSKGNRWDRNCDQCPQTAQIIEQIPKVRSAGSVFFSILSPGTHIVPHYGPHNLRIQTHLGLIVAPGYRMKIGSETRTWAEGGLLVFDDSFEHEVWIESNCNRIVLLIDIWHSDLSSAEIAAFRAMDAALANISQDYASYGKLHAIRAQNESAATFPE